VTESLLLDVLPEVFQVSAQRSAPLRALLVAAGDMHAPVMRLLDRIDTVIDPYRAPDALVPYLSRWVDLDWLTLAEQDGSAGALGVPVARQRDLIASAADLSARRGTAAGLRRFLFLVTGVDGFEVEDVPGRFHLIVHVPAAAADQVHLVRRVVEFTKPAHVTDEIIVAPEPAGPAVPAEPDASEAADTSDPGGDSRPEAPEEGVVPPAAGGPQ
jgi:phage tail-like protein